MSVGNILLINHTHKVVYILIKYCLFSIKYIWANIDVCIILKKMILSQI